MLRGLTSNSGWYLAAVQLENEGWPESKVELLRGLTQDEMNRTEEAYGHLVRHSADDPISIVRRNLGELEDYLDEVSILHDLVSPEDIHHPFAVADEVDRRFLNWLLSVRLLITQVEIRIRRRYGDGSPELRELKALTAEYWESSFEYRFVDQLNRYVVHFGVPSIKAWLSDISSWMGSDFDFWEPRIAFDRDDLLEWGGWDAKVKEDLEGLTEEFEAGEIVRNATAFLEGVWEKFRELEHPFFSECLEFLSHLLGQVPMNLGHAAVVRPVDGGPEMEFLPVNVVLDKLRREMDT
jgi:hypothetical protein